MLNLKTFTNRQEVEGSSFLQQVRLAACHRIGRKLGHVLRLVYEDEGFALDPVDKVLGVLAGLLKPGRDVLNS